MRMLKFMVLGLIFASMSLGVTTSGCRRVRFVDVARDGAGLEGRRTGFSCSPRLVVPALADGQITVRKGPSCDFRHY